MICDKEKADETGYAAEPYVNGVDMPTAVLGYVNQHKDANNCGMFCIVNGTTALNYPKNGNFYIQWISDRRFTGGILVTATELQHPEKVYKCIINELGQVVQPWESYSSIKSATFSGTTDVTGNILITSIDPIIIIGVIVSNGNYMAYPVLWASNNGRYIHVMDSSGALAANVAASGTYWYVTI